jgi:hypothetical protein
MADESWETTGGVESARGRVWLPVELRAFWVASLAVFVLMFVVAG